jgi:hypothetical protein
VDKGYRRRKLLLVAAILLPLLVTGGAIADPLHPGAKRGNELGNELGTEPAQWTNPAALAPGGAGVAAQVTRLALGAFEAPAPGANLSTGLPEGVPVADASDLPSGAKPQTLPSGAKPQTLTTVRASTARFNAVGVTWQEAARLGPLSVAVRGHRPGGDWGPWQAVGAAELDRDPTVGPVASGSRRVRGGADLVWLGASDGVELSVTTMGGNAPHDILADLIDPIADAPFTAEPVQSTGSAPDRPDMPPIYRRAAWGADEREMNWRPAYGTGIKAVVLHHTATDGDYTEADVPGIMRAIYEYQTVSRGWGDIGYNALVDKYGRIWEGRSGGLSRPVVGAQAGGFNTGTAGIAVIGTYTDQDMPPAAAESVSRYAAWKFSLGPAIDPRGGVTLTGGGSTSRFSPGTTITVPRILPHRQTQPTECPGAGGMNALPAIRERAAELLGDLVKPETIRRRFVTYDAATATFHAPGADAPLLTGTPGDVPATSDFDGDGTTDPATWSAVTGTWKILGSTDGAVTTIQYGQAGDVPVPADYDGDGRADIVVFRPATGEWLGRDLGRFVYGGPGDIAVPADYNGDGAADPAVYRPATGTWYMRNTGEFRLGEAWHVPVPADYDGDGKADPASWSPVSHKFFVRGMGPVQLGAAGDVPVPGRYDGDAPADFAVFHKNAQGQGVYEIRGRGTYVAGAPGDLPVPLR